MPHIIVEYSANLEPVMDLDGMLAGLHRAARDCGVFPPAGVRTRAEPRDRYLIADGNPDHGFVHVTVRMGHGRADAVRQQLAQHLFDQLCSHLQPLYETRGLGISLDLQESDPRTSFKRINLADWTADTGADG